MPCNTIPHHEIKSMIVTTIHHPTIATNQLRNMSHCTQNWDMIVTTIHHPTISNPAYTHHSNQIRTRSIVTHCARSIVTHFPSNTSTPPLSFRGAITPISLKFEHYHVSITGIVKLDHTKNQTTSTAWSPACTVERYPTCLSTAAQSRNVHECELLMVIIR